MRLNFSLLLCVCLVVLLVASVESNSKPTKSGSKSKHDKKTPGRSETGKHSHGHRHKDHSSTSEEDRPKHKDKKDKLQDHRKHVHDGHRRRNQTFLDAEREFSSQTTVKHNKTHGNLKIRNIHTFDKKGNLTIISQANSKNSSHFGNAKNATLFPVLSNSSRLFNNSHQIPSKANNKNATNPLYGWSITNSSHHANTSSFQQVFTNRTHQPIISQEIPLNALNKSSINPSYGWSVSNSSQHSNYKPNLTDFLNKNTSKLSYGWNVTQQTNKTRGFDEGYSKQFVDSSGKMLPIYNNYERAPAANLPMFNPNAKTMTQIYPNIGWNVNQNQGAIAQTNGQSVSQHFGPPPQVGWYQNPPYNQQQFNHYGNYDPGFVNYEKKKDKKKKKKFKIDFSLEDFSLEDLSLDDANLKDILKDAKKRQDKLKKLLQARTIEKLPTRRLYAAKFPTVEQGLTLEELSPKGILPNISSRSFTGYFNNTNSSKIFAGLESSKVDEVLLRMKRDLSPQGQAMANAINKFLEHERDCNETLEARRKKREVEGLLITKKSNDWKKNTSAEPVISNFDFDSVEVIMQGKFGVQIFAGFPQIQPLDSDQGLDQKEEDTGQVLGNQLDHGKNKFEQGGEGRQAKQQSQTYEAEINYEPKLGPRLQRKHAITTEDFQQAMVNGSMTNQNGMNHPTLFSENKVKTPISVPKTLNPLKLGSENKVNPPESVPKTLTPSALRSENKVPNPESVPKILTPPTLGSENKVNPPESVPKILTPSALVSENKVTTPESLPKTLTPPTLGSENIVTSPKSVPKTLSPPTSAPENKVTTPTPVPENKVTTPTSVPINTTPLALVSENKTSKNVTRLSKVDQTIGDFLRKWPIGVRTKLRPVNESLESWKKSFIKNITEQTPENILSRSTRSILPFENKSFNSSNTTSLFQNSASPQIYLYNDFVAASNSGQNYVYPKYLESEPNGHSNDGIISFYTERNAINNFIGSTTLKDVQKNITSERLKSQPDLDQPVSASNNYKSIYDARLEAAKYSTEKSHFAENKMQKNDDEQYINKLSHFGREDNIHKEKIIGTTMSSIELNNMGKMYTPIILDHTDEKSSQNILNITPQTPESKNRIHSMAEYVTAEKRTYSTNISKPVAIYSTFNEKRQDSNENTKYNDSLSFEFSSEESEEYSGESTTLPTPHEASLGLSHRSIVIHRVRPKTGIANRKRIKKIYQQLVSPSIKTVTKDPGGSIINAPLKKLVCPPGYRKVRGRCKLIWR